MQRWRGKQKAQDPTPRRVLAANGLAGSDPCWRRMSTPVVMRLASRLLNQADIDDGVIAAGFEGVATVRSVRAFQDAGPWYLSQLTR